MPGFSLGEFGQVSGRLPGESPNCDCSVGSDEFPPAATASMTVIVPQRTAWKFTAIAATLSALKQATISPYVGCHVGSNQPPDDDDLRIHCIGPREGFT